MTKKRGTSKIPMVMGIIGAILQLPGAFASGACVAGYYSWMSRSKPVVDDPGFIFLAIGIISALIGFVSAPFGKKSPVAAGIGLFVAAALTGITCIGFNPLSFIALILFIVGGIMAFAQKKEEVQT